MKRYKPPRKDSKGFWTYVMDWIGGSLVYGGFIAIIKILGYDWIIYNYELFAYFVVVLLFGIAAQIWRRMFFGTVNGKIVFETGEVLSNQFEDIEISLRAIDDKVKVGTVSQNAKGEFLFQRKIPVGRKFTLAVDVGNSRVVTEDIGEIEGVRWLFRQPHFRLPLSSGQTKEVDLVVPKIPENTIASRRPPRTSFSYHHLPGIILGTALIIVMCWGATGEIWSRFFEGTIYGQVTREDGDTNRLENIEVILGFSDRAKEKIPKKWRPVLTNSKGEYRFENCVSINDEFINIKVKYESGVPGYYREISKNVEGIAGVRRFLGLPISSGIPKRVDFVIPDIPPPIIGN